MAKDREAIKKTLMMNGGLLHLMVTDVDKDYSDDGNFVRVDAQIIETGENIHFDAYYVGKRNI